MLAFHSGYILYKHTHTFTKLIWIFFFKEIVLPALYIQMTGVVNRQLCALPRVSQTELPHTQSSK